MTKSQPQATQLVLPRFSDSFLQDHAGLVMADPKIAIIELVANAWDAGADRVDITWPESLSEHMAIHDNGTGMTKDEFIDRWRELGYNRVQAQGDEIVFPEGNRRSNRKAFGRNGKGRHSMFCFATEYTVETWRDGPCNTFKVERSHGELPFAIIHISATRKKKHGTIISAELIANHLPVQTVRELIGSKFVTDPSFQIYVNSEIVDLMDLSHVIDTEEINVDGLGIVRIHRFDSQKRGRTSKQHGVAWWVNQRLVGEPSWRGFDDDAYLDARSTEARRYTFVVEADMLASEVRPDWSGFKDSAKFSQVHTIIHDHILGLIRKLMTNVHKSRKVAALEANREGLKSLTPLSQYQVGKFLDEIQSTAPTITQKDLSATVEVLAKLEQSRSRFRLMEQLAKLDPDDLDGLSKLLDEWTIADARVVLDELGQRLQLIETLQNLLESPSADELHDIQPVFERGLWIFGPEYEAIAFMSNRTLVTVLEELLKDKVVKPKSPRRRPDFVVLPDSTIGLYSSDAHDERGEVSGIAKVLIVELKRVGLEITVNEVRQADDYAKEIQRSGKVEKTTEIEAFVLGGRTAEDSRDRLVQGNVTVYAKPYSTVLRQAHARTFNLQKKLDELGKEKNLVDLEVEQVINSPARTMSGNGRKHDEWTATTILPKRAGFVCARCGAPIERGDLNAHWRRCVRGDDR